MSPITTLIPAFKKVVAMPKPTPLAPPVMNATFPLKSFMLRALMNAALESITVVFSRRWVQAIWLRGHTICGLEVWHSDLIPIEAKPFD
jgi:hypothetical protein